MKRDPGSEQRATGGRSLPSRLARSLGPWRRSVVASAQSRRALIQHLFTPHSPCLKDVPPRGRAQDHQALLHDVHGVIVVTRLHDSLARGVMRSLHAHDGLRDEIMRAVAENFHVVYPDVQSLDGSAAQAGRHALEQAGVGGGVLQRVTPLEELAQLLLERRFEPPLG